MFYVTLIRVETKIILNLGFLHPENVKMNIDFMLMQIRLINQNCGRKIIKATKSQ